MKIKEVKIRFKKHVYGSWYEATGTPESLGRRIAGIISMMAKGRITENSKKADAARFASALRHAVEKNKIGKELIFSTAGMAYEIGINAHKSPKYNIFFIIEEVKQKNKEDFIEDLRSSFPVGGTVGGISHGGCWVQVIDSNFHDVTQTVASVLEYEYNEERGVKVPTYRTTPIDFLTIKLGRLLFPEEEYPLRGRLIQALGKKGRGGYARGNGIAIHWPNGYNGRIPVWKVGEFLVEAWSEKEALEEVKNAINYSRREELGYHARDIPNVAIKIIDPN